MNLEILLLQRKKTLLRLWFDLLLGTYPPEAARMLKKESSQFANPVGHTFFKAMEEILDEFLGENQADRMSPLLDRIIRIRAVQDFAPSGALAFVFLLKNVAREAIGTDIAEGRVPAEELAEFDARVDGLALAAMDVYSRCRDNLYEVRIKEIKARTQRLLVRAEILAEVPPRKPGEEQK
ncbi:MAG: RsbRD N-terminal domain-containing protein [Syntrophobacteraceae bacterium]